MATDKSEPRVGIIAQVAVVAIVTLVAVRVTLVAYFDRVAHGEELRKVGTNDALINLRADEAQRLKTGAMPIDKAIEMMATKGRMGASPDVMPSASKDVAPLQGWVKLPSQVPSAMTAPSAEPAPAPAASSASPGGSAAPSGSAAPAGSARPSPGRPKPKQP